MIARGPSLGGLPIAAGDVLLKKYRVERLIGEGGTGIVLAATHVQLEQRVAIKFLRRALESEDLRTRFEREARAMGRIESDHVVLVLDAGALPDGAPYMVMEYLEGRDLARVLKEDGPLPVQTAVDCMLQVCEALQQAHAAGIVHRDLKPANLFLTQREDDLVHVKVVDFGISKILDPSLIVDGRRHDVTSAYEVLGSPRYMAPEQLKSSRDVDGRADLWSVGTVLFQLVTGKHAFDADGNVRATLAVLAGEPQKLCALAPHAPRALEAVVSRCLEKDVTRRFQSANELALALRPFASERVKESLDRLGADAAPNLQIALGISEASTPLPLDAPLEARARPPSSPPQPAQAAPSAPGANHPSPVPHGGWAEGGAVLPAAAPSPARVGAPAKLAFVAASAIACVLLLGGFLTFKIAARAPRAVRTAAQPPSALASNLPPPKVTLDAGRASP